MLDGVTWAARRSKDLRVSEMDGLEQLLAFSISVPREELVVARAPHEA